MGASTGRTCSKSPSDRVGNATAAAGSRNLDVVSGLGKNGKVGAGRTARARISASLCIGSLFVLGCTTQGQGGRCVPGEEPACACPSGAAGAKICQSDGTYGPCSCPGSGLDASGADAYLDATSPAFDGATGEDTSAVADATLDSASGSDSRREGSSGPSDATTKPEGASDAGADGGSTSDASCGDLYSSPITFTGTISGPMPSLADGGSPFTL
jgi:hypothetical protein